MPPESVERLDLVPYDGASDQPSARIAAGDDFGNDMARIARRTSAGDRRQRSKVNRKIIIAASLKTSSQPVPGRVDR
jgi:hypothetical protein